MRYISTYESFSGNASFSWLRKLDNEAYLKLTELLYSIFDEFEIKEKTDEEFSDDDQPTNKFWTYRLEDARNINDDTSDFNNIGDKKITSIIVFNIDHNDYKQFRKELEELKPRVESYVGKKLIIGHETIESSPGYEIYDFIIKLVKIEHEKGTKNLPVVDDVNKIKEILDETYQIKTGKILDEDVNYITVSDSTIYLTGPHFNKGVATEKIYNNLKLTNSFPESSIRRAIKEWIDSHSK